MAFVVEDGNGLPAANAYADVAYADAYFADRGITAWAAVNSTAKQVALIKGTDYIDTNFGSRFKGQRAFISCPPDETVDQALQFPRVEGDGYVGDASYYYDAYTYGSVSYNSAPPEKPVQIPNALKKANCEYALRALQNGTLQPDPEVDPSGLMVASKTETVGPITEQLTFYNVAGIQVTQPYPAADVLLKPLLRPTGVTIRG